MNVYDIGAGGGEGELAVLANLTSDGGDAPGETAEDDDSNLGLILGSAALVLSLIALGNSLRRRTT